MARRVVLAIPIPAEVEDVLQILSDVARGWAAAKVETDGSMLTVTASRRRAQRPAPDEEPDEDYTIIPNGLPRPISQAAWNELTKPEPPTPEETSAFFNALDPQPYLEPAPEPVVRPDPDALVEDDPATAFALSARVGE